MTDFVSRTTNSTAWFVLNRPDDLNALTSEMVEGLSDFLRAAESDNAIRCIVIAGSGRAFCAGADLKATDSAASAPIGEPDFYDRVYDVFGALRELPKPTIASLNGFTLAGGLELAMCCDLIVASDKAKIGDAHANFGVYPGAGGAAILPRVVPLNIAKYLLFTGKTLSADEMRNYGLINEVVPHEELVQATQELADHVAAKSPIGLRRMKVVANETHAQSVSDALRHERHYFRQHLRSADMVEGLSAFQEKRTPNFEGR